MTEARICPQCETNLPPDAPAGMCPRCLLQQGLASQQGPTSAHSSAFTPPTPTELANVLPQFEILELVGQGGMGAVYKARQPGLDRLVAIKILPPQVGRDPAFAERFTREARALARLTHPSIVTVHDFGQARSPGAHTSANTRGEEEGLYYLVMEYVDGVDLRQTIRAGGLTPTDALAIVPQICDALQYAHEEGIVHRDIKPENILIDRRGRVKIADFGLAKLLGQENNDHLTSTQQVMGTLRYMAPEQMEASRAVDHRADIYSLGVVFYELLTGELPVGRFPPPSRKVQVDVQLDEVVLRALESEPEKRYQHASDVKTDVEAVVKGERASSRVTDHQTPRRTLTPHEEEPAPQGSSMLFKSLVAIWFLTVGLLAVIATVQGTVAWWMVLWVVVPPALWGIWQLVKKPWRSFQRSIAEMDPASRSFIATTAFVLFVLALAFTGLVAFAVVVPVIPMLGLVSLLLAVLLALIATVLGFVAFGAPQGKVAALGGLLLLLTIVGFFTVMTPVATERNPSQPQPKVTVEPLKRAKPIRR